MTEPLNPPVFVPNRFVKWLFLYTRKFEQEQAPRVPGLNHTDGWAVPDMVLFLLFAAVGEIFGLWLLYSYGVSHDYGGLDLSSTLGLFLGDVAAAILLHWHKGLSCERRNRIFVHGAAAAHRFKWPLVFTRLLQILAVSALVFMAFIKVNAYFNIATEEELGLGYRTGIALLYVGIALTHIFCTGYFLAELLSRILTSVQKDRFESASSQLVAHTEAKLPLPAPRVPHAAYCWEETRFHVGGVGVDGIKVDGADYRVWKEGDDLVVSSRGLLVDSSIDQAVNAQGTNASARYEVACAMKNHQLHQLDTDPPGPPAAPDRE